MDVSRYTTDDLILFRRVLDRAVAEADSDMPVELMARRLFGAARGGERNPDHLVAAVLGRGNFPEQLVKFSPPPIPAYIPHPGR